MLIKIIELGIDKKRFREAYEELYRRLKSHKVVEYLRSKLDPRHAEVVLSAIRELPHPDVASPYDMWTICREILSGRLEPLYQFFGEEARQLREEMREEYPRIVVPLPPREPREMLESTFSMLSETLTFTQKTYALLKDIAPIVERIVLKGQCPYCGRDLVTVVVNENELRLRCRQSPYEECKRWEWRIGSVDKVPRP
jgi:hypothetical protein